MCAGKVLFGQCSLEREFVTEYWWMYDRQYQSQWRLGLKKWLDFTVPPQIARRLLVYGGQNLFTLTDMIISDMNSSQLILIPPS